MTFRETGEGPFGFRGEAERLKLIRDPGDVRRVTADKASREDRADMERGTEVLPGPYAVWEKVGDGVYRARNMRTMSQEE